MTTVNTISPIERARALGQQGDYRGIVNVLNEFLKNEPNDLNGLFLLGAACFKLNLS